MATKTARKPGRPISEENRARRREEILDAAGKLFAKHGYSEAATQAIADVLKVGKGTIYRYFPTKRELFLAAADRVMKRLMEAVDQRVAGVDDPFISTGRAIEAYLEFFAEQPELVELLIQERRTSKTARRLPTSSIATRMKGGGKTASARSSRRGGSAIFRSAASPTCLLISCTAPCSPTISPVGGSRRANRRRIFWTSRLNGMLSDAERERHRKER